MSSEEQRGALLMSVRVLSTRWLVFGWGAIAAMAAIFVLEIARGKRPMFGVVAMALPLLVRVLHPKMKIFEKGIEVPPKEHGLRFLAWPQMERYSWDGDQLIVAGTQAMLAGGPVAGFSVRIPSVRKGEVDQFLATKIA